MESEEMTTGKVHHGRNIRRTRIDKNIKQDVLSELVHMTQPNVSKYENTRVIDDEMLQRFAKALNVPFEYLKNLEEEAPLVVFESNTVNNRDHANSNAFGGEQHSYFNPIDRIMELYEKLLKEKDDKITMLEKRVENLENGLNK